MPMPNGYDSYKTSEPSQVATVNPVDQSDLLAPISHEAKAISTEGVVPALHNETMAPEQAAASEIAAEVRKISAAEMEVTGTLLKQVEELCDDVDEVNAKRQELFEKLQGPESTNTVQARIDELKERRHGMGEVNVANPNAEIIVEVDAAISRLELKLAQIKVAIADGVKEVTKPLGENNNITDFNSYKNRNSHHGIQNRAAA